MAIAGAGIAFLELGGLPTSEQQDKLIASLQSRLGQSHSRAEEGLMLGRWLYRLRGSDSFQPLLAVLKDVVAVSQDRALSIRRREALDEIAKFYRVT